MSNNDEDIEIENELPEMSAPFAMAFATELADKRLSSDEKILLFWLRFRAGRHESNFVKHKTLAEDMGWSERTIRNYMKRLRSLGMLKETFQGFGRPRKKRLVRPSKIYTINRMVGVYSDLRRERTAEDIDHLHCHDLDNAEKTHQERACRSLRNGGSGHCGTGVPVIAERACRSEVDISEVDISEVDRDRNSSAESADQGTGREVKSQERDREITDPADKRLHVIDGGLAKSLSCRQYPGEKENEFPGVDNHVLVGDKEEDMADASFDERLRVAREKLSQSRTDIALQERTEKKAAKVERQARQAGMSVDEFVQKKAEYKAEAADERRAQRPANSKDVETWFATGMRDSFPNITNPSWGIKTKEQKLANQLLQQYGSKLVERVIVHLFKNWERYRKEYEKQKLPVVPNIDWLYGWRKTIFAEVESEGPEIPAPSKPKKKFGW